MHETIDRLLDDIKRLEAEIAREEEKIVARRRLIGELKEAVRRYEETLRLEGERPSLPRPILPEPSYLVETLASTNSQSSTGDVPDPHANVTGWPLFGHTIVDAAKAVLSESGDWMEYAQVAEAALDRGYRSRKSGTDKRKVFRSFRELMGRNPEVFNRHPHDNKKFRLRNRESEVAPTPEQPQTTLPSPLVTRPHGDRSRIDTIEEIISECQSEHVHIQEIIDKLNARGDGLEFDRDAFWRTVDSALRRGQEKGRFRKVGQATWALAGRRQEGSEESGFNFNGG